MTEVDFIIIQVYLIQGGTRGVEIKVV